MIQNVMRTTCVSSTGMISDILYPSVSKAQEKFQKNEEILKWKMWNFKNKDRKNKTFTATA